MLDANDPLVDAALPLPADAAPAGPSDSYYANERVTLTADEVAQLWRKIDQGIAHRDQVFLPVWKAANRLWEGRHWDEARFASPDEAYLVTNLIPNTVKSLVEAVAYQHPDFTIVPRNARGEATQTIIKAALDYWWNQSKVSQQLKFAEYDARLYGIGFVQTGWLYRVENGVTLEDGRLETLPAGVPASGAALAAEHGLLAPGETAKDFVSAEDIIEDRFLAKRVSPVDMIVPVGATSVVDDWAWVAKISRRPLAEVKRDPRFRKGKGTKVILGTRELVGTTELSEPYGAYAAYLPDAVQQLPEAERPDDVRLVETVEYWERDTRRHIVLCREDRTRYLLAEKWQHETNRYPFRTRHSTHSPDEFWGKSVPVELQSVQRELNSSRQINLDASKQMVRMYQAPEDSLSNKAMTDLQAGEPGTVVQYKQGPWGNNPIVPIPALTLVPELLRAYQWALQGLEQISGLSQYQLSAPPGKRLVSQEVEAIQRGGQILFMADAAAYTQLCKEVAEDLLAYCEQFDTLIENLGVYDEGTDVQLFSHFSGSEIRGNTMVEVDPQSTAPPDAQQELDTQKMVLNVLLQATQLAAQLGGQLPRPLAITMREMLRIAGARNIDQLLPLPPIPPPAPPNLPQMALQQAQGPPPGPPPPGPPPAPQGPPPAPPAPPTTGLTPLQAQQLVNQLTPEDLQHLGVLLQGNPPHG